MFQKILYRNDQLIEIYRLMSQFSTENLTQLKFIKTGSSKIFYRYSKIYVNIKYSTIKYSRITNTKKIIMNKI